MTPKTFGKQLLEIRTTLGLSQTEVAEAAEELCLSAGTGQVCAEHHGGAAAGKGTACAGGASAPHRTGIEKAEQDRLLKEMHMEVHVL